VRRTQIYLDDDQASRLDERASADGITRSRVIRIAIDEYLTQDERDTAAWRSRWQEAVRKTSGAAPGLATGAEYVESLRHRDAERLSRLER
jgi:predicted transcriptional regulator